MKRLKYYISTLAVLLFCYSCTTEVDELFDKTATERVDENLEACKKFLIEAENGWVIDYYPDAMQSYGGYLTFAKFEANGDVTVASEIALDNGKIVPYTSHYSMLSSNSAVLTFDTYNYIFHYFADPDLGGGSNLGGDFEFTYYSGNSKEIVFRGTKTGNTIVFRALESTPGRADNWQILWQKYLDEVFDMKDRIASSPYCNFIWKEGTPDELNFAQDEKYNIFTYAPDVSNPDVRESISFTYTPSGIRLYEEIDMGGTPVMNLIWNETNFLAENASTIELTGYFSEDYIPYDTYLGNWVLTYNKTPKNVTIVENVKGSSYILRGLSSDYDIVLGFSKRTGNLSMTSQYLGTYGSYYLHLCPWDRTAGTLTWVEGVGYDLIYNRDDANPQLDFVDKGNWAGYTVDGMLLYVFSSATASYGTAVGSVQQLPLFDNMRKTK